MSLDDISEKEKLHLPLSHYSLALSAKSWVYRNWCEREYIYPPPLPFSLSYLSLQLSASRSQIEIYLKEKSTGPISSCQTVSEVALQQSCHVEHSQVSIIKVWWCKWCWRWSLACPPSMVPIQIFLIDCLW